MAKPITPDQIAEHKAKHIPDAVLEAFNKLIAIHYNGNSAKVTQDEVIDTVFMTPDNNIENGDYNKLKNTLFVKGYLNVEDIYRAAGWKVSYDKPAWDETYDAYFMFTKK